MASVVQGWVDVVKTIGSQYVPDNVLPNPKCYLAVDSYYIDASARAILSNAGVKFTASVKPDRFKPEVRMVHPAGNDDKIGEWRGIYNDTTNEMFIYHYDTQKGVGKKYNYSKGFLHSTEKRKITDHKGRIPAYENYKTMFECCDRFNRNLHDKSWPHKRGGRGVLGEFGHHHDFFMACILQDCFNAFHSATGADPLNTTFLSFCDNLADDLFAHSLSYMK